MDKAQVDTIRYWVRGVLVMLTALTTLSIHGQTYERSDSLTVCRLLQEAPQGVVTLWFARQFLNVPYVAGTLEVNSQEQLVVNTRQLDCTTLVETVAALQICARQGRRQWNDYLEALRRLRYRDGLINGYPSRLHYFSDWIRDNVKKQLVVEVQQPVPPFSAVQQIEASYMSSHPQTYRALRENPSLIDDIRSQEQSLSKTKARYIPKQAISNTALMRRTIQNGDIIAITTSKPGLEIAHLGFAVWQRDGLHLFNASQLHKKVIEEPMTLRRYMQKHPTFTGIRIIRIK